jgi:hypothetical protein
VSQYPVHPEAATLARAIRNPNRHWIAHAVTAWSVRFVMLASMVQKPFDSWRIVASDTSTDGTDV